MKKIVVVIVAASLVNGCAMTASGNRLAQKDQVKLPPYTGPVCVMIAPAPEDIEYQEIGMVKASKRFYGGAAELFPLLADEARKIGANAVVSVQSRQRIGLLSVVRPVTWGTAIKLADGSRLDCKSYDGVVR